MNKLLIIITCLISFQTLAQTAFHDPVVETGGVVYHCDVNAGRFIRVINSQNQITSDQDYTLPYKCRRPSTVSGWEALRNAAQNSFSLSRQQTLKNQGDYIVLRLYFNWDGTLKEVWFQLKKDTIITPDELANLEHDLKQQQIVLSNPDCVGVTDFYRTQMMLSF